jgi:hypothetical protein
MILLQIHHMWYETNMIKECWDSILGAIKAAPDADVKVKICFNQQTYIETPDGSFNTSTFFDKHNNHPLLHEKNIEIVIKTDKDPFYNIADWRREVYDTQAKYTVWGETDCLLPKEFFVILDQIEIDIPHVVTFASRPMWDNSWDIVTHKDLQGYSKPCQCGDQHREDCIELLEAPLKYKDYITQKELDKFNAKATEVLLEQVPLKIDGSLVCISKGHNTPFIAPGMHFVREDTCFEQVCRIKKIPQVVIKSHLKGHNYKHPNKRVGTFSTRNDKVFKEYADESIRSMQTFLQEL